MRCRRPFLAALGLALVFGLANGWLIAYAEVPSLFTTLASGLFLAGLGQVAFFRLDIVQWSPQLDAFAWVGRGTLAGMPMPVVMFGVVALAVSFFLRRTRLGMYVYAIGDNPFGARTTGIPTRPVIVLQYVLAALIGAFAGMVMAASVNSMPTRIYNSTMIYDVILVVVLGGIGLSGGRGGVVNVVIGTLLIGTLLNGMTILDVSYSAQNLIKGVVLLVAILVGFVRQSAQRGDGATGRHLNGGHRAARRTIPPRETSTMTTSQTSQRAWRRRSPRAALAAGLARASARSPRARASTSRSASLPQGAAGKTVAYVPVALGFDLAQGWLEGLKKELEPLGVKIVVRDPNWNTNAGAQAVTTLISEKPDVIVVHNPDVQTYAKLLQKAEAQGIQVVQINMRSAYPSVVYRRRRLGRGRREGDERRRRRLQGQVEQDRHRAGRAVGGGQRLHAEGRRERAGEEPASSRSCRARRPTGMRPRPRASRRRCSSSTRTCAASSASGTAWTRARRRRSRKPA